MEVHFNSVLGLKDFLKSKIFELQAQESYIFKDEACAIQKRGFSLLIRRNNINCENLTPKYKYSLFQYGSEFMFQAYRNEIGPGEEAFIISISTSERGMYKLTFLSLEGKREWLKLISN